MKEESGFEMASLKLKETSTLTLRHPQTGKELPDTTLEIYSIDSEPYTKTKMRLDKARSRKMRGQRGFILDPADLEQDALQLNAACVAGWKGIKLHGEVLEYSPQNAIKLLTEVPWVRRQIDAFVADESNFLQD